MPVPAQRERPRIFGIAHASIQVSDYCKSQAFYSELLGSPRNCPLGNGGSTPAGGSMALWGGQWITLNIGSKHQRASRQETFLDEVGFFTENVAALRAALISLDLKVRDEPGPHPAFEVQDPDGHFLRFFEKNAALAKDLPLAPDQIQGRIIHAGLIVHDRPAMEHFYKDILGFRPYWHGGRKDDGVDDWVSFQVPDGTDWVEFMLNVPDNADKHLLGVMNHIALGVTDIQAAKAQLIKNGVTLTQEPKIGRDGKWQLNVYDPDDTRIEFMEFTPKGETCCSKFTAPHPKP